MHLVQDRTLASILLHRLDAQTRYFVSWSFDLEMLGAQHWCTSQPCADLLDAFRLTLHGAPSRVCASPTPQSPPSATQTHNGTHRWILGHQRANHLICPFFRTSPSQLLQSEHEDQTPTLPTFLRCSQLASACTVWAHLCPHTHYDRHRSPQTSFKGLGAPIKDTVHAL